MYVYHNMQKIQNYNVKINYYLYKFKSCAVIM